MTPTDGMLTYDEGIHIGYRAWLNAGTAPAFAFGHGLGYTSWSWDSAEADDDGYAITVTVTNTGDRAGKQVVQVYAERADSAVERPVRWLVGFAAVRAEAGESVTVSIPIPARRLALLGRRVGRRARRLHPSCRRVRRRPAAHASNGRSTRDPQPALGPRRGPRR